MDVNIEVMGEELQRLLDLLRKNREVATPEELHTKYRKAYLKLQNDINSLATEFTKSVFLKDMKLSADVPVNMQVIIINHMIETTGLTRELGKCISKTYSVEEICKIISPVKEKIQKELISYANVELCETDKLKDFVKTLDCSYAIVNPNSTEPIIYNSRTGQVWRNNNWQEQEIDYQGQGEVLLYA